ncbi:TolC family protein [Psychroserpens sp. SPM9]|uniref:TolC family protein n=1 Tax=Psychroserpens sp. SPM9 TaxID=2975598 RepID=UPI0021A43322|nr:TolC family protein [Psychroserpens sp. SPM9]MDG5492746.1 TolC family protein [Psychroserpens sp. SPM9]
MRKAKQMNLKLYITCSLMVFGIYANAQQVLSAEEAVELALDHNFGIKIANNAIEVAENNAGILNSGYLPTLNGNAGATYNVDNTEAEFSNGETTVLNGAESSRYNATVNLNYVLFDGLGRKYNYKRLKEEYQLTALDARETIETTIVQLFSIYYTVAQLSENTDALEETMVISKDRLTRAGYQFDYGQNTKLEVLNAEVDINNDSINLINIKQQLKNTKRDLNVVMGNQMSDDFDVNTEVRFLLQLDKADLLEKTKANNVSLLQAEKNIAISQFGIKENKAAQFLPQISLIGSYGWNKNNNNAASFVAVSTNTGLSGGLNLTWDLFDGGATLTRIRNAKIDLENQKLQKDLLVIEIERDFNNAWDDFQNKLIIYQVQEDNIKTAKNNFDRTQEKFKIGQVTSIEFRQAQLNLLNAELSRNQAKYDAKLAEINVLQLSGELLNVEL